MLQLFLSTFCLWQRCHLTWRFREFIPGRLPSERSMEGRQMPAKTDVEKNRKGKPVCQRFPGETKSALVGGNMDIEYIHSQRSCSYILFTATVGCKTYSTIPSYRARV